MNDIEELVVTAKAELSSLTEGSEGYKRVYDLICIMETENDIQRVLDLLDVVCYVTEDVKQEDEAL